MIHVSIHSPDVRLPLHFQTFGAMDERGRSRAMMVFVRAFPTHAPQLLEAASDHLSSLVQTLPIPQSE